MTDYETYINVLTLFDVKHKVTVSSDGRLIHLFVGAEHVTFWLKTERLRPYLAQGGKPFLAASSSTL